MRRQSLAVESLDAACLKQWEKKPSRDWRHYPSNVPQKWKIQMNYSVCFLSFMLNGISFRTMDIMDGMDSMDKEVLERL